MSAGPTPAQQLRRAGGSGEAVAAIDATFSAPKSVSAPCGRSPTPSCAQQIEAAHETAIDRALAYAIGQVPMLRRRVSQRHGGAREGRGLVATSWRHTTARAVDRPAPRPAAALPRAVARRGPPRRASWWRSTPGRWLVHQREVGAAYRTELARELAQLGFEIQRGTGRGQRYFELDGDPPAADRPLVKPPPPSPGSDPKPPRRPADALEAIIAEGGPDAVRGRAAAGAAAHDRAARPRARNGRQRSRPAAPRHRTPSKTSTPQWRRAALAHERRAANGSRSLRHAPQTALQPAAPDDVLDGADRVRRDLPRPRRPRGRAGSDPPAPRSAQALEQLGELRAADEILAAGRRDRHDPRSTAAANARSSRSPSASPARRVDPLPAATAARETDRLDQRARARRAGGCRTSNARRSSWRAARSRWW